MKTYYIYKYENDEFLGSLIAHNIDFAEIAASKLFNVESDKIYALSTAPDKPFK